MEGRNGKLFDLQASGHEYEAFIAKLVEDPKRYRALALAAFEESRSRLFGRFPGPRSSNSCAGVYDVAGPANRKEVKNNNEKNNALVFNYSSWWLRAAIEDALNTHVILSSL